MKNLVSVSCNKFSFREQFLIEHGLSVKRSHTQWVVPTESNISCHYPIESNISCYYPTESNIYCHYIFEAGAHLNNI
jgi:hypothetical protein